jgi:hypothetical protein
MDKDSLRSRAVDCGENVRQPLDPVTDGSLLPESTGVGFPALWKVRARRVSVIFDNPCHDVRVVPF